MHSTVQQGTAASTPGTGSNKPASAVQCARNSPSGACHHYSKHLTSSGKYRDIVIAVQAKVMYMDF